MLKVLKLQKQRTALQTQLKQLREKRKKLRADEDELQKQLEAATEVTPQLEQQVDELTQAQTDTEDQISDIQDQIDELTTEIEAVEADAPAADEEAPEETASRSVNLGKGARRSAAPAPEKGFRCRSRCFSSRAARDAFYAQGEVSAFVRRVRTMCGAAAAANKRGVSGADLSIPTQVLDVIRDNLEEYSKILAYVRKRSVKGKARQNVIGDIPEGVWMEMSGALNELTFSLSDIELDGYKVGGVIIIDNYLLEDSDIALGEEIMYMLGQSVGYALDKGIVYGKGPSYKMPVGIVTRLAETSQPSYWTDDRATWIDLHSANVLKLNIATASGTSFFVPLLGALKKAKRKKMSGDRVWFMNDVTKDDVLIRSMDFDSSAALMAGMNDKMPILGGDIVTLDFIPDNEIVGGYPQMYLLAERDGGQFGYSDLPLFIQDKTVFKGTARYDGQPVFGECFVAVNYANTDVTTAKSFSTDYANTDLNALVVTSAAGSTTGKTVLTVAGVVSGSNTLKAKVTAGQVDVHSGETVDSGWTAITSGTTQLAAAAGAGVTVVELDAAGKVISVGYLAAAVPKSA